MAETFERVCGTCRFGRTAPKMPKNVRICFGGPPQIITIQTPPQFAKAPDGQMKQIAPAGTQIQTQRPIVSVTDAECGFYEPKSLGQIMLENHNETAPVEVIPKKQ